MIKFCCKTAKSKDAFYSADGKSKLHEKICQEHLQVMFICTKFHCNLSKFFLKNVEIVCPTNNTTQNNQPPEDSQCYTPIKLCLGRYKQADSLIRSSPKYFIKIISCFMVPTNSRHSPRIAHSPMTKCKSLQRTLQSLTKLIGQEWSRKLCVLCYVETFCYQNQA